MEPQFVFISNYIYGGGVIFSAHLLRTLKRNSILVIDGTFENKNNGDFGFGLSYTSIPLNYLDSMKKIFITDMYKNFHILDKLTQKEITIVIHDPGEIFEENKPYLKTWNIITIRKTVKGLLKNEYDIKANFLYHPFFPYPIVNYPHLKKEAVSISRVDYNKYIDVILEANKFAKRPIKIYGWINPVYVSKLLSNLNFGKYYYGRYVKTFDAISNILSKAKFMVDLSVIPNDGGGTQYTFLEAIHNNTAIILNRKWIEGTEEKYRDFKEGINCYAVSSAEELAEIINSEIDTSRVVKEAKKLMTRHVMAGWNKVTS